MPLTALNQVDDAGLDWQIPGYRGELVHALVRTLPKDTRRALDPARRDRRSAAERLGPPHGRLVDALAAAHRGRRASVSGADFDPAAFPPHLRMNVLVLDDTGKARDADTDLAAIRARLATAAREAIAAAVPLAERRGITTWDVGTLPPIVEADHDGHRVVGFPALLDDDDSVSLRIVTTDDLQQRVMRGGVRRLLLLTAAPRSATPRGGSTRARGWRSPPAGRRSPSSPPTAASSPSTRCSTVPPCHGTKPPSPRCNAPSAPRRADRRGDAVGRSRGARRRRRRAPAPRPARRRLRAFVGRRRRRPPRRLAGRHFVINAGADRIDDVRRYVEGIAYRLDRLADDVARDVRRMAEVVPLERRYDDYLAGSGGHARAPTRSRSAGCSRSCG